MTAPSTLSLLVLALCLCTGLCTDSTKADDGYEVFPAFPWSRYKMPSFTRNWADALAFCDSDGEGSTLVVINSDEEAEVVGELIARIVAGGINPYAWMGINDVSTEGVWRTVQGGLVSESGYNKWDVGEPTGGRSYNCGFVATDPIYDDGNCASALSFICEKPNV